MNIDLRNLHEVTNDVYYPLYKNKKRFLAIGGGAGSGKSVFASDKVIFRIITEKNHKYLVIRKVANTLKDSVWTELKDSIEKFGLTSFCEFNETEKRIRIPLFNSEIICKGLDKSEKIKSIKGITSIWIEEATELTERDVKQLNLRLRGFTRSYKQIMLTFNPISHLHWIKLNYYDTVNHKVDALITTYKDNRFLDDEYIGELLDEKDKYYKMVYTLGQWGILTNIIFTKWEVRDFDDLDIIDDGKTIKFLDTFSTQYHGVDYGWNDPNAYVRITIKEKTLYVHEELYLKKYTNDQFIDEVEKVHDKKRHITSEVAPDKIKEFRQRGFRITAAKKPKGSIQDGIDFLKRFNIVISDKCQNFINEIQLYKYREDKEGNVIKEEPVDKFNHLMDSARYAVEELWAKRNQKQKVGNKGIGDVLGWG